LSERTFFSLIRIEPLAEKRDRLLEILISVAGHTRLTVGCTGCMVCEERGDGNAVLYLERWRSREALHRHVRSDLYIRVLHAMDLASEPPESSFYEISGEKGLELIQELRREEQETASGPSERVEGIIQNSGRNHSE
jgi:quinol monooxygenase YgiN